MEQKLKAVDKFIKTPLIFILVCLMLTVPYLLSGYIVDGVFELLCESFPEVFDRKDVITSPAEYAVQFKVMTAIKATLAFFAVAFVSIIADNSRCEYVISLTDGRYTILRGLGLYHRVFWLSDVITGILPPVLLSMPAALIPEKILRYGFDMLLMPSLEAIEAFGIIKGTVCFVIISVAVRLLASVPALVRWRVAWLSGSV